MTYIPLRVGREDVMIPFVYFFKRGSLALAGANAHGDRIVRLWYRRSWTRRDMCPGTFYEQS